MTIFLDKFANKRNKKRSNRSMSNYGNAPSPHDDMTPLATKNQWLRKRKARYQHRLYIEACQETDTIYD